MKLIPDNVSQDFLDGMKTGQMLQYLFNLPSYAYCVSASSPSAANLNQYVEFFNSLGFDVDVKEDIIIIKKRNNDLQTFLQSIPDVEYS